MFHEHQPRAIVKFVSWRECSSATRTVFAGVLAVETNWATAQGVIEWR
jgi:hypothetical protein